VIPKILSDALPASSTAMVEAARLIVHSDQVDLPVLPEVSAQLLSLTADVECDPKDIVDLFRRDQSLTGHLLKTANSVPSKPMRARCA